MNINMDVDENLTAGKEEERTVNGYTVTSSAKLIGVNLCDADLSNMFLMGTDFTGSNLEGANFQGSVLIGVKFDRASLERADFSRAVIKASYFHCAQASNAKFNSTIIQDTEFYETDLKFSSFLGNATIAGCTFSHSYLSRTEFCASVMACFFRCVDASGMCMDISDMDNCFFDLCSLLSARFSNVSLRNVSISCCQVSYSSFCDCTAESLILENCETSHAKLPENTTVRHEE